MSSSFTREVREWPAGRDKIKYPGSPTKAHDKTYIWWLVHYYSIFVKPWQTKCGKTQGSPEVTPVTFLHGYFPLRHQFLPVFLSFRTSHPTLGLVQDHREEFNGKFRESGILICVIHLTSYPFALLGRHIRGGKDLLCRIDQEQDEDLVVTWLGGILQTEWLHLVLVQVRERDASVGLGDHVADTLHTRGVPDTQVSQFPGLGRR